MMQARDIWEAFNKFYIFYLNKTRKNQKNLFQVQTCSLSTVDLGFSYMPQVVWSNLFSQIYSWSINGGFTSWQHVCTILVS